MPRAWHLFTVLVLEMQGAASLFAILGVEGRFFAAAQFGDRNERARSGESKTLASQQSMELLKSNGSSVPFIVYFTYIYICIDTPGFVILQLDGKQSLFHVIDYSGIGIIILDICDALGFLCASGQHA